MTQVNNLSELLKNRDFTILAASVALVTLSVAWLPGLLRRGWYDDGSVNLTRTILSTFEPIGISLAGIQAVGVGAFLTLLVLVLFDRKKRVQAVLLCIGVLGVGLVFVFTNFIPRIFVGPLSAHLSSLLVGAGLGVMLGLPRKARRALVNKNRSFDWEFRRAARLISGLVLVSIATMVIEANVAYPTIDIAQDIPGYTQELLVGVALSSLVLDGFAATIYVAAFWFFVTYDRKRTIFAVGPKNAGKTYFSVGAYLEESTRAGGKVKAPSSSLVEKIGMVSNRAKIEETPSWSLGSTDPGEPETLSFTFIDGQVFPTDLTVQTLDYAGENLPGLARLLEDSALTRDNLDESKLPKSANDEDVRQIYDRCEASDTLVLLFDATTLFRDAASDAHTAFGAESGLGAYAPLIERYSGEKGIVFVVTKADILDEEYAQTHGIDIYDRQHLDVFADDLYRRLATHTELGQYITDAEATDVYPVYFRTEIDSTGKRVPYRPRDDRPLVPYGFSRLLEAL